MRSGGSRTLDVRRRCFRPPTPLTKTRLSLLSSFESPSYRQWHWCSCRGFSIPTLDPDCSCSNPANKIHSTNNQIIIKYYIISIFHLSLSLSQFSHCLAKFHCHDTVSIIRDISRIASYLPNFLYQEILNSSNNERGNVKNDRKSWIWKKLILDKTLGWLHFSCGRRFNYLTARQADSSRDEDIDFNNVTL